MFARNISIRLKPNMVKEFTAIFEKEVLPILSKQTGFCDEILIEADGASQVRSISLWDSREHAEAYEKSVYPGILKSLEKFLDGPPKVRPSTVLSTTMQGAGVAKGVVSAA